jgi:hypothetical protein
MVLSLWSHSPEVFAHWNQQPCHGRPALESTTVSTASRLTSTGINNRVTASRPTSAGINNRVMAYQRWNQQPRHSQPAGCTGPGLPEPPLIRLVGCPHGAVVTVSLPRSFRSLEIFALPSRRSSRTQGILSYKVYCSLEADPPPLL